MLALRGQRLKVILSIIISLLLLSCSIHTTYNEPHLVRLSYQFIPSHWWGLPSEIYEVKEEVKAPKGLYAFVSDKDSPITFAVIEGSVDALTLEFNNGEIFNLFSDYRINKRDNQRRFNDFKKFHFMFNELIRMNISEDEIAKIEATVKTNESDRSPNLINNGESIGLNNTEDRKIIGYAMDKDIPEYYQNKKIVGELIVEGTVNKEGKMVNPMVVDNSGTEIMASAAIELSERLLFEPAIIWGDISDFKGASFVVIFVLDDSIEEGM